MESLNPFSSSSRQQAPQAPQETVGLGEPSTGGGDSGAKPSGGNNFFMAAIVVAVLYYGWPIIEALILVLPIPNPQMITENIKAFGNIGLDILNSIFKSDTQRRNAQPS